MKRTTRLAIPAALLLVAVLLGGPAARPVQAHPSTFPDVAETHIAHVAIEGLAAEGIVAGALSGEFRPDNPVLRSQAAKITTIWRGVYPSEPSTSDPHFSDVEEAARLYVEAASAQGWMTGYPDGTFRPYEPLSRQQMAAIVIRALGWEDEALRLTDRETAGLLERFRDADAISPGARPHVAVAVMKGLLSGDGDRLNPVANVTRAQFSLVVHRAKAVGEGGLTIPPAHDPTSDGGSGVADSTDVDAPTDQEPTGPTTPDPAEPALTPAERAQADFMDTYLFRPRNSPVTGEMVVQNARWYGIPAISQLVIMAAETSLGDPKLGGALARHYNFGCLRYHGSDTAWGLLSSGKIWVAGKDWYSFGSPQIGMVAFGRYLKAGVNGLYVPILSAQNPAWEKFAAVYYGRNVPGFGSYVDRLHTLEDRFRSMAAGQGLSL